MTPRKDIDKRLLTYWLTIPIYQSIRWRVVKQPKIYGERLHYFR